MWGVPELEYLRHKISAAGVLSLPSHVAVIQEFPPPSLIKALQAFLGMVNFYSRFLPSIASTEKLCAGRKGSEKLEWSAATQAAFPAARQALLSATHKAHPTLGADLSLVVDASATHAMRASSSNFLAGKIGSPWASSQ